MMFQLADDAGDIYLRNYEGWYDVREERFVPDNEAELSGFKDEHGFAMSSSSAPWQHAVSFWTPGVDYCAFTPC